MRSACFAFERSAIIATGSRRMNLASLLELDAGVPEGSHLDIPPGGWNGAG